MNANNASALGAGPPYLFTFNKFSYAEFLDETKVLNHTHIVFGSVSFI
jgi:hypothetical protein